MGIMKDIQDIGGPHRRVDNTVRRTLKTGEELGELSEAVLCTTSTSGAKEKTWLDVVEEAVDVAIMGIDIALTKPPEWTDIDDKMWRDIVKSVFAKKLAKWRDQVGNGTTLVDETLPSFTAQEHDGFVELLNASYEATCNAQERRTRDINIQFQKELDAGLHK